MKNERLEFHNTKKKFKNYGYVSNAAQTIGIQETAHINKRLHEKEGIERHVKVPGRNIGVIENSNTDALSGLTLISIVFLIR